MAATHGRIVTPEDYRPAAWLPGPHLQTIWGALRRVACPPLRRERFELPDGDFLDLTWTPANDGPLVLVLHGLEGSADSAYARALLGALDGAGTCGVLMHFRGCSGELNRLDRSYHSGDTGDLACVLQTLAGRGTPPAAVIGYSLGGNVLLKWLGERGDASPLVTAVAVSVPFDLGACADRLDQGFSRFYQWRLVESMKARYHAKFATRPSPVGLAHVDHLRSFRQYDDAVTAPLHGFRDAEHYYRESSSRTFLRAITTPTLILHASDDPFVPPHAIPSAAELAPSVTLELSDRGGHVGFMTGAHPAAAHCWLEPRILRHLAEHLGLRRGRA